MSWRSARPKGRALVVLDSWALLVYLKDEPAAGRIETEWLKGGAAVTPSAMTSSATSARKAQRNNRPARPGDSPPAAI